MNPVLVHIHIPKSAGSSHQYYLYDVLGRPAVHWYRGEGITPAFDALAIAPFAALGGHRPLSFYPADLDVLYTCVIREPVARAVSYFTFRADPLRSPERNWSDQRRRAADKWVQRGLDPHSLARSLENCEALRSAVSNVQCAYLSRFEPTLDGVLETLRSTPLVVGVFEDMGPFNDFYRESLGFAMSNPYKLNPSSAAVQQAAQSEPRVLEMLREMNTQDTALYDHVCNAHGALLNNAQDTESIRSRLPVVNNGSNLQIDSVSFDWSLVHLYSKGRMGLTPGVEAAVPLIISNRTSQNLVFTGSARGGCQLGWQLQDERGQTIEGAQGLMPLELLVRPGECRDTVVNMVLEERHVSRASDYQLEFSVVADGVWLNTKQPLHTACGRLLLA